MLPCPTCKSSRVEQINAIDENRVLQCSVCRSRYSVKLEIVTLWLKKTACKQKPPHYHRWTMPPCPNCNKNNGRIYKTEPDSINNTSVKHVCCCDCGSRYSVYVQFIGHITKGIGQMSLINPESFVKSLASNSKKQLLAMLQETL